MHAQVQWKWDPSHSRIGFRIRHMGISMVEGAFQKADIKVTSPSEKQWDGTKVNVTIDVNSINTANQKRDAHLRSDDFFDAKKYPVIRFESTGMKKMGKDEASGSTVYEMPGMLEIKGVKKPVTPKVRYYGTIRDPWGNTRAGFRVSGEIDRAGFGIHYEKKTESGNLLIGRKVYLDIPVELIKAK